MDIVLRRVLSLIPQKENGGFVHGAKKAFAQSLGYKGGEIVSDWIAGRSDTYLSKIYEISEKYGVSAEWLLGKTDEKQKPTDNGELDEDLLKISELVSSLDESRLDAVLEIAQKISVLEKDEVTALLAVIRSMGKK